MAGLTFELKKSGAFSEKKLLAPTVIQHFGGEKWKIEKVNFLSDFLALQGLLHTYKV